MAVADDIRIEALAQRLADCAQWASQHKVGMRLLDPPGHWPGPARVCEDAETPLRYDGIDGIIALRAGQWWPATSQDSFLPDLTDPATVGCLWAMLIEAMKHVGTLDAATMEWDLDEGTTVWTYDKDEGGNGTDKAAAPGEAIAHELLRIWGQHE